MNKKELTNVDVIDLIFIINRKYARYGLSCEQIIRFLFQYIIIIILITNYFISSI